MGTQLVSWITSLLWLSTIATAMAATPVARAGCQDSCGGVTIPYPFGIGNNCSADETFAVTCNSSRGGGSPRPFITSINLELLQVSVTLGMVRVNNPVITSNCPNRVNNREAFLTGSPFWFSDTHNRFTAMGCDNLALITRQSTTIGGCMSLCNVTTARDRTCVGINCCQTRIPPQLKFINASLRSIDANNARGRSCKFAFMVEQDWFNELIDPYAVQDMENVPALLEWTTFASCTSFQSSFTTTSISNGSVSLCGANASCSNKNTTQLCSCNRGYRGNPYLSNGCQDIDECANPSDNSCEMYCANVPGSYNCYCGEGYISIGSYSCFKLSNSKLSNSKTKTAVIGICSSIGLLFLLIGTWLLWKVLRRRKQNKLKEKFFKRNGGLLLQQQLSSGESNIEKTKLFTSKELEKATDNYNRDRILGQGGQGTVYKGMLTDGKIVAIKKSKVVDEGQLEQFINEVVILSQINHRNVVKLLGCCLETEVPLLVYEFIPNGTLFGYIHNENEEFPLSWNRRLQIAAEVAGALSYLHSAASIPIFHRDIKSTNILLDDKYRAKVADFGTSKSVPEDKTHFTTRVQGTFGYLDPEYFQSSQFTEKSDVYSFGVVLVELLSGQKPTTAPITREGRSLATHFILAMEEDRLFSSLLDARVQKEGTKEEIIVVANLAKRCLNLNGKRRPTMKQAASELDGLRVSRAASDAQIIYTEEAKYEVAELDGPWDTTSTSTSTGSCFETGRPKSNDFQPLLYQ